MPTTTTATMGNSAGEKKKARRPLPLLFKRTVVSGHLDASRYKELETEVKREKRVRRERERDREREGRSDAQIRKKRL